MEKPYKVTLKKLERFQDPRECQIDVDVPYLSVAHLNLPGGKDQKRVMPFRDGAEKKFLSFIKRKTKTLRAMDSSHYWVSGYHALHFYLKSSNDRAKIKKIVLEAVEASGGFMTVEEWDVVRGGRQRKRFVGAEGTGSAIRVSGLCNPEYL